MPYPPTSFNLTYRRFSEIYILHVNISNFSIINQI